MHSVSIIIVHWNTPNLLEKQLSQLSVDTSIEIIVIDNASIEDLSSFQNNFPHVTFVANDINRGFAFACNQGAINAKGDWLLFLNPDVAVTPEGLHEWVFKAENKGYDASSPIPLSEDYAKPLPSIIQLLHEFTPLNKIVPTLPAKYKTLTGGALLINKHVFMDIGGWDERFFLWFEDSDLTKRLIDSGYKTGWVDVAAGHTGGAAFTGLPHQWQKDVFFHSMGIYARKHFSLLGRSIVQIIKKRYTSRLLLPIQENGVSIVVPNVKIDLLKQFLQQNHSAFEEKPVNEVTVVTSALNHDNVWTFRKQYPFIRFILLEKNGGFASTVNVGFRVSRSRWPSTVNDDTTLSADWVNQCLSCANEETGSINPVIYDQNASVETAGIQVEKKGKARPITRVTSHTCFQTDATNAAAVLYNSNALNTAGLFDEKFGSYLEDIDLSLRLKKFQYKNIVATQSKVTHLGHATSKTTLYRKKEFYDLRNWIYIILKNWSFTDIVKYFPAIIIERMKNLSGVLRSFT